MREIHVSFHDSSDDLESTDELINALLEGKLDEMQSWRDWEEDLQKLSLQFPGVLLSFEVKWEGDSIHELQMLFVKDGKSITKHCEVQVLYPSLEEGELDSTPSVDGRHCTCGSGVHWRDCQGIEGYTGYCG